MSDPLRAILVSLATRRRSLGDGEYLFHRDDPVSALFIVEGGRINLLRYSEDGAAVILQRAGAGDIVAEASVFSPRYHCDALAEGPTVVRPVDKRRFRERFRDDAGFAEAWARHLGQEIQALRLRGELLCLKTVAARLDAWLAWHGAAPPKGEWKRLAQEIGVSPEALYRELARRRH